MRQVNRFVRPDRELIKQKLNQNVNLNYISSPANINTMVKLPLARLKQRIEAKLANKKLTFNNAVLKVEITDLDSSKLAEPLVRYLLLIKKDDMSNFFKKNDLGFL